MLSTKKYPPKISALVLQFSIPLIFVAFMLLFFPFRDKLQFDGDEGINLMKTVLVMRGYPLYDQIWSDQPPLLTYLLLAAFRVFGVDVNVGRFSVLLLSAVLLWASFQVLRLVWGNFHALAGVLLILLLPYYMTLSVSVMVGLPSLTFAMLSLLAVIAWHLHRKYIWLILSAVALAISVLIKLFTGFLAPIIIVGILLADFSPKISLESVKSDGKIIFLGILVADFSRLRVKTILRELLLPAACWGLVFS
ncbi:MAG: glycosyltransferase family 39 protein, partial [Anaerolineales bacterium]